MRPEPLQDPRDLSRRLADGQPLAQRRVPEALDDILAAKDRFEQRDVLFGKEVESAVGIPGEPTNFVEIILYPGYAFGTAQDPVQLDHLDSYQWQDGALGAPSPQTNDPDAASKVFTIDAVQWDVIAALATDAPRLASVEEGEVSHIIITRDVFTDVHDVIVRIYVSGPRGNAFIEATPDGTIIRIV